MYQKCVFLTPRKKYNHNDSDLNDKSLPQQLLYYVVAIFPIN